MTSIRRVYVVLLLVYCASSWSEVTLDGSIGSAGALTGPDYQITENLGQRAGSNLFHSFGQFNLQSAESATFSGNPAIQNVISRVTGGSPSNIDGTLRSTIPNANLYFLNPAGVFFGPNASLDVQGSFHVSTADYLGLKDGTRFVANLLSDNQVLTTATPKTFGFLGDNPSAITLAQAELEVPNGKILSVIGGDIDFVGGQLIVPAGRIDLASVSSKGEVVRQNNDLSLSGFKQLGKIKLTQSAELNTSGEGGGAIFIRGGELTLNNADVISDTLGTNAGKAIDIVLPQGMLEMRNGSRIAATSEGAGKGSDLQIEAQSIFISDDGSEFTTGLNTQSFSTGNGGHIELTTESLEVVNGGEISAKTFDAGNGGNVLLDADSVMLSGDGAENPTGVFTTTASTGIAGNLTIQSNSLDVNAGAIIVTRTVGTGNGGVVLVEAEKVRMTGNSSSISATSGDKGNSQDIIIKTDSLEVSDGAFINTTVLAGTGNSANLLIEAKDIVLTDNPSDSFTGILGVSFNNKDAGNVTLITENLEVRNGAQVSTSAFGIGNGGDILVTAKNISLFDSGGLITSAVMNSAGNAGTVAIKADNLEVRDKGFVIASTNGTGKGSDMLITAGNIVIAGGNLNSLTTLKGIGGDAGEIIIKTNNLEMQNGTGVSNATELSKNTVAGIHAITTGTGNGGDITIEAGNLLLTGKHPSISADTVDAGNAGNVTFNIDNLELRNGTRVSTSTSGTGTGGDILMTAKNVLLSDGATLNAFTGDSGDAGKIEIATNNLEVRKGSILFAFTEGLGDGGDVIVETGNLLLSGDGAVDFTGILAGTGDGNTGDAGVVTIDATQLDIRDGAVIETSTLGTAKGGDISLKGKSVLLSVDGSSRNTGLLSRSLDIGDNAGNAGKITITVDDSLSILDDASISVETETANAGDINITANNLLQLSDSKVTSSVANGKGNGGNILIGQEPNSVGRVRVPNVTVLDDSEVSAQAEQGMGGNIGITSDFIFRNNSIVSASSNEGVDGTVNINSPETNISGSIVALPENYINASEHLSERCTARSANVSSLVVKDRNTIPPSPDDASSSSSMLFENNLPQGFSANTMSNSHRVVVSQQRKTESTDLHSLSTNPDNSTGLLLAEAGCGK